MSLKIVHSDALLAYFVYVLKRLKILADSQHN